MHLVIDQINHRFEKVDTDFNSDLIQLSVTYAQLYTFIFLFNKQHRCSQGDTLPMNPYQINPAIEF